LKGAVAGISQVARSHLLVANERRLPYVADDLMDWALSLRSAAAAEVCGKSRPLRLDGASSRVASPLEGRAHPRGDERMMILSAVAQLAVEDGYEALTVTRIRAAAGVSRRRFDAHFEGVVDCFLAALDTLLERTLVEARDAYLRAGGWPVGVHPALLRVCQLLAQEPNLVKLIFFELFAPGTETLRWQAGLVSNLGSLLRGIASEEHRPTVPASEASVAAVLALLRRQARAGRAQSLPSIAGALSYLVLAPAIGPEVAAAAIRGPGPTITPIGDQERIAQSS